MNKMQRQDWMLPAIFLAFVLGASTALAAPAASSMPVTATTPGLLLEGSSLAAPVDFPTRYRTETIVQQEKGPPVEMALASDGNKSRTEIRQDGQPVSIIINRPDLGLRYEISPAQRTYRRLPLDATEAPTNPAADSNAQWYPLGAEKVGDNECVKYRVVSPVRQASGRMEAADLLYWVDPKTRTPVKIQQGTGAAAVTTEFRKTQLGPVEAGLFEPPADYTPVF